MGLTTEQIHQPLVGVASCWNEAAPCNIALMRQAQAVKKGVSAGGGTPREFCTITVTDGMAMGHDGMRSSLPSRECIADSVELTVRGHAYDAIVGLAGCDKSLPGMMMAMVRLNVPSIFIYGGSILPGNFRGQQVTVQDMFEAVGKHSVGAMSDEDLDEIERVACPSAGACGAQFTANTMATVSEAIGLALPYSAGAPAPYEIRDAFCMTAGEKVMELVRAARHRHPEIPGERRSRGRGLRRLDQCRAAPAGDRQRVWHQVRPVRCGGNLQKNTLCRGFEAGRPLCRQRHV
jgi:dihydroxy-acid dehydratase